MILKLMAEQKPQPHFGHYLALSCVQTGSGNTTSLRCPGGDFCRARALCLCLLPGRPTCSARGGRRSESGQFGMVRVTR
jgi:hypothetical protein